MHTIMRMIRFKEYVCPKTVEEAYELTQKKSNVAVGGMLWIKMKKKRYNTAVDLRGLGLDYIREDEESFKIGAMTSLRDIEISPNLEKEYGTCFKDALGGIVGVQFRNSATLGGSIFGRFGFSDVYTLLLSMGAKIRLHKGGVRSLDEFRGFPRNYRDIITEVIIPKNIENTVYLSQRNSATDFPVVACSVCKRKDGIFASVGARPYLAESFRVDDEWETGITKLRFGSNIRAGEQYRRKVASVLVKRCLNKIEGGSK